MRRGPFNTSISDKGLLLFDFLAQQTLASHQLISCRWSNLIISDCWFCIRCIAPWLHYKEYSVFGLLENWHSAFIYRCGFFSNPFLKTYSILYLEIFNRSSIISSLSYCVPLPCDRLMNCLSVAASNVKEKQFVSKRNKVYITLYSMGNFVPLVSPFLDIISRLRPTVMWNTGGDFTKRPSFLVVRVNGHHRLNKLSRDSFSFLYDVSDVVVTLWKFTTLSSCLTAAKKERMKKKKKIKRQKGTTDFLKCFTTLSPSCLFGCNCHLVIPPSKGINKLLFIFLPRLTQENETLYSFNQRRKSFSFLSFSRNLNLTDIINSKLYTYISMSRRAM